MEKINHKVIRPIIGLTVIAIITISILVYNNYINNLDKITLTGTVENKVVSAISTVPGRIIELYKEQGQAVKKGEIIALIDDTNAKYTVEQLEAVVKLKSAKLDEIEKGARPQQISQLEAQLRAAKAQWDLLKSGSRTEQKEQAAVAVSIASKAVQTAEISYDYISSQYDNAKTAFDKGLITKADLDAANYKKDIAVEQLSTAKLQKENAELQYALVKKGSTTQAIAAAKAGYDAVKASLELAKAGATSQTIIMAKADLSQSKSQLAQAKTNLENYKITALADGIIISKNYNLGDVINASANIADIAVDNGLDVIAYIPDKYLGKIKYGQKLKVKTEIGNIDGIVNYIDLAHEYTPVDKQSTNDSKHKATKIKVKISDKSGVLKSGMKAEIEIELK